MFGQNFSEEVLLIFGLKSVFSLGATAKVKGGAVEGAQTVSLRFFFLILFCVFCPNTRPKQCHRTVIQKGHQASPKR